VITTPYIFFATASGVSRLGALPVFVDIDPETYNISPRKYRLPQKNHGDKKIKPFCQSTSTAMCGHGFNPRDRTRPWTCRSSKMPLKHRARYKDRKRVYGRVGCFSFSPSKNLGGFGDGGMVTTDNKTLAEQVGY
jgi:hypothetical protein